MAEDAELNQNPFPYPGARGLLTSGVPAVAPSFVSGLLAQVAATTADALTVELFGSPAQKAQVHAWMQQNRETSR